MIREYKNRESLECHYVGRPLEEGARPSAFYFSLSSKESLTLEPYNSPALYLEDPEIRLFSISLPFHETPDSKFHAMGEWAKKMKEGNYFLEDFLEKAESLIRSMIAENLVDPNHIALLGLSRGGLIAGLLAARIMEVKYLLGFAPVTDLSLLEDFKNIHDTHLEDRLRDLSLNSKIEKLIHLRNLRFYIGNRDEKVSTDSAYHFIRNLSEKVHEMRCRKFAIELFISHSIGYKGHGTSPLNFRDGSLWLKNLLLEKCDGLLSDHSHQE